MRVSNNPNVSFKAQFVMKIDPITHGYPTEDKFEKAIDFSSRKSNNLLKFFGFLQSKEGCAVLKRLPKDDVIRLDAPFQIDDANHRISIQPYLVYEPSGLTEKQQKELSYAIPGFKAEGTFLNASKKMAPQFKKWVNDLVIARKTIEDFYYLK